MHRYKLQAAEEVTGGYGRELIGTIIGYALPGSRRRAIERLENEAQEAYKTGNFEIALDRFCHYLGLVEADPSTTVVSEMRATLTSNIGACLHNLGDVDGAVEYYERAAQEFKAVPNTLYNKLSLIWLLYGNLVDKRVTYVEQKLASIRAGEAPDPSSYQDGYGKTRKWTREEMEGKAFSIYSPKSWFGYGKLETVEVQTNTGAGAA